MIDLTKLCKPQDQIMSDYLTPYHHLHPQTCLAPRLIICLSNCPTFLLIDNSRLTFHMTFLDEAGGLCEHTWCVRGVQGSTSVTSQDAGQYSFYPSVVRIMTEASLLTAKIFMNAAGFLHIPQESFSKSFMSRNNKDSDLQDPLDNTQIHCDPEDYDFARKMATDTLKLDEEDIHGELLLYVVSLSMHDDENFKKLSSCFQVKRNGLCARASSSPQCAPQLWC
jgi:hypothetical protein